MNNSASLKNTLPVVQVGNTPKISKIYLITYILKLLASKSASVKKAEDAHFILKCYCKDLKHLQIIEIFLLLLKLNVNSCEDQQVIVSTVTSTHLQI